MGRVPPPDCAIAVVDRRSSSKDADDGQSILRTRIPYGLLRCFTISINFFLSSAAGTPPEALTNKLPYPADAVPNGPGMRPRPLDVSKPFNAGVRVNRKDFSTPCSISASGF